MNKSDMYQLWIYSLLALSSSAIKSVKKEISLGTSFTLECDRKISSQVRWYKNGDLVYSNQSARISINSKWRKSLMKVEDAINNDTGLYKCYGFKNGKEMDEIIAYNISLASSGLKNHNRELRFADPHSMELRTFVVTPSGEDQTFSCLAIGDEPISYSWYKNSHRVSIERSDFLLNVQGPELALKELTLADSGNYTCRAKNGYDEIEFQFELRVQEKMRARPYIEKGMPVNHTRFIGETAILPCYELMGGTLPDFRWLKSKQNITKPLLDFLLEEHEDVSKYVEILRAELYKQVSKRSDAGVIYGVELILKNLTRNDSGWYTCLVSNHVGSDSLNMNLNVVERKEPHRLENGW